MMMPSVLITRPDPAGSRFAERLLAGLKRDVPVVFSPLMRIEPCGELPALSDIKTLIFTSRNGVEAFAKACDQREFECYTVGDATADAARTIGMLATSCGGDADGLVMQILAHGAQPPCLHIRGEQGVGDVASRLTAMGLQTNEAVLYRQVSVPLSDEAIALLNGQAPVVVPLFSARSARLFCEGHKGDAPLYVAAISQAVVDALSCGNIQAMAVATSPNAAGMVEATRAVLAQANPLEGDTPAQ